MKRPRRSPRITKLKGRIAQQQHREDVISVVGQIGLYVLSNPEAMRVVGMVLEATGRAMQQHSADSTKTTPTSPSNVFDLSALREKKEPSDG